MITKASALLILLWMFSAALVSQSVVGGGSEDLCIDMNTAYDQGFKWYNTAGPLPAYMGDHYLFTGSSSTNMYQDAVSLRTIKVGKAFALSARVSIYIDSKSPSSRDEFAIFVSDDAKVFTGDEFGFVVRQDSASLFGYLQSPRLYEFFKEFKLADIQVGREETYNLKAVYSELDGRAIVRYFINDVNVLVYDFPVVTGEELYLIVSSKKLSDPSLDTSKNFMKVYSACVVNLPAPRIDVATNPASQVIDDFNKIMVMTDLLTLMTLLVVFIVVLRIYRVVRNTPNKSS